jgi:hypothetical protein
MRLEISREQALATMDLTLSNVDLVSTPYPHFTIPDLFDTETASAMLTWLEEDVSWSVETHSLYVFHKGLGLMERASGPAAVLLAPETLHCMCKHLERVFGTTLSRSQFNLSAHRMLPGHRIGIHTDIPSDGTETHRFLVTLNREFDDDKGGHLVLLDINDLDGAVILRPIHNAAVGMELSERSYHCVDEIRSGTRYSLVYSFWSESAVTAEAKTSQPPADGPGGINEQKLRDMRSLLRELGADAVPHTSRSLLDQLNGVYELLREWQCDNDVCKAGLFHGVFGTPSLPGSLITGDYLSNMRELIGERALLLVKLHSRMDLPSVRRIASGENISDSGSTVALSLKDKRALVSLMWANIVEQSRYVPISDEVMIELKQFFRDTSQLLPSKSEADIRSLLSISRSVNVSL